MCKSIQVFEFVTRQVCFYLSVRRHLFNTMALHKLRLFLSVDIQHMQASTKPAKPLIFHKINYKTIPPGQLIALPYVISVGNHAASLSKPLSLPLSNFLPAPSEW